MMCVLQWNEEEGANEHASVPLPISPSLPPPIVTPPSFNRHAPSTPPPHALQQPPVRSFLLPSPPPSLSTHGHARTAHARENVHTYWPAMIQHFYFGITVRQGPASGRAPYLKTTNGC